MKLKTIYIHPDFTKEAQPHSNLPKNSLMIFHYAVLEFSFMTFKKKKKIITFGKKKKKSESKLSKIEKLHTI